jgi:hypothetical protein
VQCEHRERRERLRHGSVMGRGEPVRRSSGFLKIRNEVTKCRGLGRSLDRPERLQSRRKGEPVPPAVSLHLTR